jgi:serine protease inhibitor
LGPEDLKGVVSQKWSKNTDLKTLFYRLETPMMSGRFELPLGYSRELECSILEMPFSQKRVSLFLLLPDDPIDGINQLERNLTSNNLKSLFSTLKVRVRA